MTPSHLPAGARHGDGGGLEDAPLLLLVAARVEAADVAHHLGADEVARDDEAAKGESHVHRLLDRQPEDGRAAPAALGAGERLRFEEDDLPSSFGQRRSDREARDTAADDHHTGHGNRLEPRAPCVNVPSHACGQLAGRLRSAG